MTTRIPVYLRGEVVEHAIADEADAALAEHRWTLIGAGYAARRAEGKTILLHREIMGLEVGDDREVDHVNRAKLDCRRSNLRVVTHAENRQNNAPDGNATWRGQPTSSALRGVSYDKRRRKWKATVTVGGTTHHLGRFATAEEAHARAVEFRAAHMPYAADAALAA